MKKQIKGLTSAQVKESRAQYGDNSLVEEKRKGFIIRFLENLSDPIIKVLLIALLLNVLISLGNIDYLETFGILAAVLVSTTVSTLSEYKSERAFEKLSSDNGDDKIKAIRDGKICEIGISEVVVGDLIYICAGEKICADGEIIQGRIHVDQSALNGESIECEKRESSGGDWELSNTGRVFRGTFVTEGNGMMRVGRVGINTFYGMIAKDVQTDKRESPLKLRLSHLASQISKIGYVAAAVVGLTFLFKSFIIDNNFRAELIISELKNLKGLLSTLIHALSLMITVVVVAAPEGLPMMITVVLSANMKRMLRDKILVKRSVGIETAGSLNILFTDKTGTITVGKPQCDRIITACSVYKNPRALKRCERLYNAILINVKYNTDVIYSQGSVIGGNSTEKALYEFFLDEATPECMVVKKTPFSSERKQSSCEIDGGVTFIKGAPEWIIDASKYALSDSGEIGNFDKSAIKSELIHASSRGERVLCLAMRDPVRCDGMIFVALIVMKDKIRKGVREAVQRVHRAGIQTVMITGDGKETAIAIAEECGIMNRNAGHIALSSDEVANMSDEQIMKILPRLRVISRALPRDKSRLVRLAQELDLVTGMTGDGINDAPSLKLCDVGFSMGDGTEIAKSASDIVILDNSFSAISKTVLYGRTIFKSIRKFITFQLIMNLCACGISFIGQFVGVQTPITIIQMLWVNIIMDTLGGLAFAGEGAMEYYMCEAPKKRDEPILTGKMITNIMITGAYTLLLCILFLTSPVIKGLYGGFYSGDRFYTAFYALFIFSGVFNCLCARSERLWLFSGIGRNKPFVFIMLLILIIQIFMIYFGGALFRCVPLEIYELSFVFLLASSVVPFDMFRRIAVKLK